MKKYENYLLISEKYKESQDNKKKKKIVEKIRLINRERKMIKQDRD